MTDGMNLVRTLITHRAHVLEGMKMLYGVLERRALTHDLSKLKDDEFEGFCRINAGVRSGATFGSPAYRELMQRERHVIDLHFSRNRHHPEFFSDQTTGNEWAATSMTLVDVIEMVTDWWAAWKAYGDGRRWAESFQVNLRHKEKYLSQEQLWVVDQMAQILSDAE